MGRIPDGGASKKLAGFFIRNLVKLMNLAPAELLPRHADCAALRGAGRGGGGGGGFKEGQEAVARSLDSHRHSHSDPVCRLSRAAPRRLLPHHGLQGRRKSPITGMNYEN
jgi:hypothetical protein